MVDSSNLMERIMQDSMHNLTILGRQFKRLTLHVIFWGIWLERNRRCYEGKERNLNQVIYEIKKSNIEMEASNQGR